MKTFIFSLFFILLCDGLYARQDSLSLCMEGLSIHPENQRDFAEHYDRRLDSHGDFVITPGFLLCYDRAVSNESFSHVRIMGSYISDCALLPAGYVGAGVILPFADDRVSKITIHRSCIRTAV